MSDRPSTAPAGAPLHWEAGHGKIRVYVLDKMYPALASKDPRKPRYPLLSHADRSAAMKSSASKWVENYRTKKQGWTAERKAKLDRDAAFAAEFHERQARQAAIQCLSGAHSRLQFRPGERVAYDEHRAIKDQARPHEVWQPGWGANSICEVSGLPVQCGNSRRCRYCNVVIHLSALNAGRGPGDEEDNGQYVCPDCEHEVAMSVDELTYERTRRREAAIASSCIVKLQKVLRGRNELAVYGISKHGMRQLQSLARGAIARYTLQSRVGATPRPYWLRVLCATGLRDTAPKGPGGSLAGDPSSFVILSVLKGTDEEKALFRFDTRCVTGTLSPQFSVDSDGAGASRSSSSSSSSSSRVAYAGAGVAAATMAASAATCQATHGHCSWAPFFVPGMDGSVALLATVIGKRSSRLLFLGQAALRLRSREFRHVWRHGGRFQLPLTPMQVAPKERSGRVVRLSGADVDGSKITGSITLELAPSPFSCSCCGFLEQKDETCLARGVQMASSVKARWCVLADGVLRIYGVHGDEVPRATIVAKKAGRAKVVPLLGGKSWQRLIALYIGTQTHVFLPMMRDQTMEWCNKLAACAQPPRKLSPH
jgi:hypothetical protein